MSLLHDISLSNVIMVNTCIALTMVHSSFTTEQWIVYTFVVKLQQCGVKGHRQRSNVHKLFSDQCLILKQDKENIYGLQI